VFACERSDGHYYYKDDRLLTAHRPDSVCILAPGDVVWESDLQALRDIHQGKPAACSLRGVVAKYLINDAIQNR